MTAGSDAPLIALEIHDVSLWEPSRVLPVIDTMERWGYNALVLHQNDLLDVCTQLFLSANYGVADLRLKKVRNSVAWLNRLVDHLARFGAKLFLEIKEPSFHDYALEQYPELLGPDGYPNPTSPRWFEFCNQKTEDLIERVPGIGGLIVNISSPESRVSLPDHLAKHGGTRTIAEWFDRMINAFQAPLERTGKKLYVRDFSYTTDLQSEVLQAVSRQNGKVGASVKITAHDYFPEFPENPAASLVDDSLVFEFEAFGEHTGWGVIPNCRVAELAERMKGYREHQASGMIVRISWEAISGSSAMQSLSAVNVFALPRLVEADIDATRLVLDWLSSEYDLDGAFAAQAAQLLLESWHIPAAAYWETQVFPRHSCLPSSWQEGWLSMETSGMGNRHQKIAILPDDPRLSEAAREKLFAEKESATALADRLAKDADSLSSQLPEKLAKQFSTFQWLPFFARQFELATKATFYSARALDGDLKLLPPLKNSLLKLADDLEWKLAEHRDLPHHVSLLLSPDQIRLFVQSVP